MPPPGRLASFSRLWGLIWFSICLHWEAFTEAVRRDGLVALVRLRQIRDTASAKLFSITSGNFIAFEDTTIVPSLVQAASGVVLELGPGPGNQIHRYNTSLVNYVYGIEPNPHFQTDINAKLEKHGLRDKYKLIVSGVEDSDVLRKEGITEGSGGYRAMHQGPVRGKGSKDRDEGVWKLLKPGGKFIFWEHGSSRNHLTSVAQAFSDPAWSTFVGCHLTRNILADILNSGEWENPGDIEEPEDPFSCMPRVQGVLIKKA